MLIELSMAYRELLVMALKNCLCLTKAMAQTKAFTKKA